MSDVFAGVRCCFRRVLRIASIAIPAGALFLSSSSRAVIIDSSTLFGASSKDLAVDVALDGNGNIYLMGVVGATTFPGLDLLSLPNGGRGQIFVAKFDANGSTLQYVVVVGTPVPNPATDTTLGLAGGNRTMALAVDVAGAAYVAAYESTGAGGRFVGKRYLYKLDAAGHVQWAFPLDPAIASVRAVAVDASGSAYIAGNAAPGLATTPGVVYPATNRPSGLTPCLLKVDPAGQRASYATYLSQSGQRQYNGPSSFDRPVYDFQTTPYALAVDGSGSAYVTGQATSDFAATPGALDLGSTVHSHTFVAKLNPSASALNYVARTGGLNSDRGTSIVVAPDGSAVVGGKALISSVALGPGYFDFPVIPGPLGVFQDHVYCYGPACGGGPDPNHGYILKLRPDGSASFSGLVSSCGGSLAPQSIAYAPSVEESPVRVGLDVAGNVWAAGTTCDQRGFPTTNPILPNLTTGAFVMEVYGDGHHQRFGTVFGSGQGAGLSADGFGNVVLAGYGAAPTFPLVASWQSSAALPASTSQANAFLMRLSDASMPVSLSADVNPSGAGSPVHLTAAVAASRDQGSVEFLDSGTSLGASPLAGGVATLSVTFPAGIHPLTAVYHGPGQFDGSASFVVYEVVNTSCP